MAMSLTPTSQLATSLDSIVKLVLPGDTLFSLHSTYTFSLSVGNIRTKITIVYNSPPSHGSFGVNPPSGQAVQTMFRFLASHWIDEELPLSYEFGYLYTSKSSINSSNLVSERIEINTVGSYLPVGLTEKFSLFSFCRIYDSLDGSVTHNQPVVVHPTNDSWVNSIQAVNLNALQQQSLALVNSMLNKKECSNNLNCSDKSREDCFSVTNTCGIVF
jgi:hypothetical protein